MSHIIANTYEILQEIGSGGGGVVFLGRHLRLGKLVVLKADRRTLSAKPEVLRREVDALKNLSHTYIPQVYDFLVEDGVVYTVMDYIEGESLDKPLKRGERFRQATVVKWACQLLEALAYHIEILNDENRNQYNVFFKKDLSYQWQNEWRIILVSNGAPLIGENDHHFVASIKPLSWFHIGHIRELRDNSIEIKEVDDSEVDGNVLRQ